MCFYVKRYIILPMTVINRGRFIKGRWLTSTGMRVISSQLFLLLDPFGLKYIMYCTKINIIK